METNREKFIETIKHLPYSTFIIVKGKGKFDVWDGGMLWLENVEFKQLPKDMQRKYQKEKAKTAVRSPHRPKGRRIRAHTSKSDGVGARRP